MNEINSNKLENRLVIIDPINILNKYALFSSYKNDIVFVNKEPILCGGFIKELGRNVYNLKNNEFVGYISHQNNINLKISANLVFKMNEESKRLLCVLPYASNAMNVLRRIDPKIGQSIVIIGLNLFSLLLFKLLRLFGVITFILSKNEHSNAFIINNQEKEFIFDKKNNILNQNAIDSLVITELNEEIIENVREILEKLKVQRIYIIELALNPNNGEKMNFPYLLVKKYDIGFFDSDYLSGIRYPFPYVRWDYKRNLEFFIDLVEKEKITLDYFKLLEIPVNSSEEIKDKIEKIEEESLILFG